MLKSASVPIVSAALLLVSASAGGMAVAAEPDGFPFTLGRYVIDSDCDSTDNSYAIVDFAADHSHGYEADGNVKFTKIKRVSDDEYRITEEWPGAEGFVPYKVEARYLRTGPETMRRIVKEDGETYTDEYRYCTPTTAVGRM